MGYELLLLPVPQGADIEESGEALAVRMASGQARAPTSARARELSALLGVSVPELVLAASQDGDASSIEMRGPADLRLDVTDSFLRVDVPYALFGAVAEEAFACVFKLLGAAAGTTGWRAYDPQKAGGTLLDESGQLSTQELYLSVMDHLYPDSVAECRRRPRQAASESPSHPSE